MTNYRNVTRFTCGYGQFSASFERTTPNRGAMVNMALTQFSQQVGAMLGEILCQELAYRLQERRHRAQHRINDVVDAEFSEADSPDNSVVKPNRSMCILP